MYVPPQPEIYSYTYVIDDTVPISPHVRMHSRSGLRDGLWLNGSQAHTQERFIMNSAATVVA